MRKFPEDILDEKELQKLNAEQWQIDLLKLNPSYVWWGNFEDYMSKDGGGWDSRVNLSSWNEHWELDELNELVNFYFELYRENHECPHCEGSGLNKETKQLADDWYDFNGTGRRWCDKITQDEVEELVRHGRLSDYMPTKKWYRYEEDTNKWFVMDESNGWENRKWVESEIPEMPKASSVNMGQNQRGMHSHDAINRWICVEKRAKRLGIYGHCDHCVSGRIYDEQTAKIALQLWYLLPRKGCSRGVYIKNIEQNEIPEIINYLKVAADRNNNRFSAVLNSGQSVQVSDTTEAQ